MTFKRSLIQEGICAIPVYVHMPEYIENAVKVQFFHILTTFLGETMLCRRKIKSISVGVKDK